MVRLPYLRVGFVAVDKSEALMPTQIRRERLDLARRTCGPPGHQRPGTFASARSGGGPVDSPAHPNRTIDQLPQRTAVDLIEAPDIQAALSARVRTQPRQHRPVPALELADQVDG